MRTILSISCVLMGIAVAAPAQAQIQQQIDWCVNKEDRFSLDLMISGCNAAIQSGRYSGKGLAWAYNNLCDAFGRQKNFQRAIAECQRAIQLDPVEPNAHYNLGNTYYDMGDYPSAIASYDQAIRVNPNDVSAYFNRGLAYDTTGRVELAIADFRKAHALGHQRAGEMLRKKGVTP